LSFLEFEKDSDENLKEIILLKQDVTVNANRGLTQDIETEQATQPGINGYEGGKGCL